MSVVSRVGFLRRGFILAVLKDAGKKPEVREELIIEVRNGRISLLRHPGGERRGQVVAWLDVIILLTSSEVRGLNWVKTEEGIGGGRMEAEIKEELMSFTFWVK